MKLLCLALCAATAAASADPDSTLIFSHAAGPDVVLSYDGSALKIPGYCGEGRCVDNARAVADLRRSSEAVDVDHSRRITANEASANTNARDILSTAADVHTLEQGLTSLVSLVDGQDKRNQNLFQTLRETDKDIRDLVTSETNSRQVQDQLLRTEIGFATNLITSLREKQDSDRKGLLADIKAVSTVVDANQVFLVGSISAESSARTSRTSTNNSSRNRQSLPQDWVVTVLINH